MTTCVEPTVYAIDSTATMLKIYRLSSFDRAPPGVDHTRKVIRMKGFVGRPMLHFLSRLSRICQDLRVLQFALACRIQDRHKPRNAVDDQTQALLVCADGLLGGFPLSKIRCCYGGYFFVGDLGFDFSTV